VNVQKIFDMLQEDRDDPALGIICAELEEQGYSVRVDGQDVNSADVYDSRHKNLEDKLGSLDMPFTGTAHWSRNFPWNSSMTAKSS
jgi:hypothetical protein